MWFSPDGLTWQRSRLGDQTAGTDIPAWATAGPEGYILLTNSWTEAGPSPLLWASTDGAAWTSPTPSGVSGFVNRAAVMTDRQLVLFGNQDNSKDDTTQDADIRPLQIWSASIQQSTP